MLEASNNTLGWRDVQAILVATSRRTDDDGDDSWVINGAGYSHSYKYGFGIIDAAAAVNASRTWTNFGPEEQILLDSGTLSLEIQNNEVSTTTSSLSLAEHRDDFLVESVVVYIDVVHASRGDLLVELESPAGIVSILHPSKRSEYSLVEDDERWKLMTVRNFYENPSGTWTLRITDEHEQKVTGCIDLPYDTEVEEHDYTYVYDCFEIEYLEDCVDGAVNTTFDWANTLDTVNNRTGVEACCACGGGVEAPVVDILRGWRMIIYGHNATVPPTDDGTGSASAVSKTP